MGIFDSLGALFSSRGKATSLYKKGMEKAKNRDFEGAIDDYTNILRLDKAPHDIKSMARFNRALARSSTGDYEQAKEDLRGVLASSETPDSIRQAASDKLKRYEQHAARPDDE